RDWSSDVCSSDLMALVQAQQRERQADLVVEIALGLERLAEGGLEHGGGELLGGGLSVGAGDGAERDRKSRAVRPRERPQRRERLLHPHQRKVESGRWLVAAARDRQRRPACRRGEEIVGVEVRAAQRDEGGAG